MVWISYDELMLLLKHSDESDTTLLNSLDCDFAAFASVSS